MTQRITALRLQLRHLSPVQLAIDIIIMAAVGMLAMFVLLLASFQNFDALYFESGLRYDNRAVIEQRSEDGLVLTVTEGTRVMSERRFDDPERWSGDFNDATSPVVWSHTDASGAELAAVLGASMISSESGEAHTLLDEATAATLGVAAGDGIVLSTWSGDVCRLELDGVTRSYKEVGGSSISGLLVVASDACAAGVTTWTEEDTTFLQFNAVTPAATAQSRDERLLEIAVAATGFQVSGLLPAILLLGLGLWTVVGLRAAARVRHRLELASDLLFDLGCRMSRVRSTYLLVTSAATVLAALGAAWGAHEALWRMASFYTQTAHWVGVAILFAGSVITITVALHLRAARRASRRPQPISGSTAASASSQGES